MPAKMRAIIAVGFVCLLSPLAVLSANEVAPAKERGQWAFFRDQYRTFLLPIYQFLTSYLRYVQFAPKGPQVQLIFPGTKWCGDGNKAANDHDFGRFGSMDKCCKAHDMCKEGITAGEQYKNLQNDGLFTRSHCDCDVAFKNCLQNASEPADLIGVVYFNVLGPQCFRNTLPAKCANRFMVFLRCIKYVEKEESTELIYQWFDADIYYINGFKRIRQLVHFTIRTVQEFLDIFLDNLNFFFGDPSILLGGANILSPISRLF